MGDVINLGYSPINVSFSKKKFEIEKTTNVPDGILDSLKSVLKEHIRPNSESCALLRGLTNPF